ncbi:MAG: hypothetical protein PHI59_08115 [Candidatus Omnitrophica bacterium]|nr:hypothetical protein [Candidatus Omnitrophota bacterium]
MSEKKEPKNTRENMLEGAWLCLRNKECLKNPDVTCPAIADVSEELIFIKKKNTRTCNYYVPFGYDGFCTCPHRKELFKKYKK